MDRLEQTISELLRSSVSPRLKNMLLYPAQSGGKRLRPRLAFLSCRALGGRERDVLSAAAALEILHNYSLILDDLIDRSPKRRGRATAWKKFGPSAAELVAVLYGASAFQGAMRSPCPEATAALLAETLKELTEGELEDLLLEQAGREDPYFKRNRVQRAGLRTYADMALKKTGALLAASCVAGALAARASRKRQTQLASYGRNLGIAFQITDDLLDFFGGRRFGKPRGQDFREHKLGNILTLLALQELDGNGRRKLWALLRKDKIRVRDIAEGIALVRATNAKERARKLAASYGARAQRSLRGFPANRFTKELAELAERMISRTV